jgi:hypothetical protein
MWRGLLKIEREKKGRNGGRGRLEERQQRTRVAGAVCPPLALVGGKSPGLLAQSQAPERKPRPVTKVGLGVAACPELTFDACTALVTSSSLLCSGQCHVPAKHQDTFLPRHTFPSWFIAHRHHTGDIPSRSIRSSTVTRSKRGLSRPTTAQTWAPAIVPDRRDQQ